MQVGQVISGKYRLLRLLGDGGMGSVYEAQHEVLGTRVAIKVLHEDLVRKPGLVDRFLREARVSAQIQNPHVVRVLDVDRTADGAAYIVMELLAGEELSAVLGREHRLPLPVAVDYAIQILDALSAAHALGVVHRDLKPENVFVTMESGRPRLRLIDFGIAKARPLNDGPNLTVSGTLMGTPEYMAPEQAHSADKADARSDLYAVGVILYEMLSGTRPVDGADPRVVAVKVERGDVKALIHVMPEVPRDLAGLVHRAMAPVPHLRFSSATEMRAALEAVAKGQKPVTGIMRAQASGTIPGEPPSGVRGSAPPSAVETQTRLTAPPRYSVPGTALPAAGDGQAWGPPPPGYAVAQNNRLSAPPRGRGRRSGSLLWVAIAVPILLGGGLVVAFAVNSASGNSANPPPVVTSAPSATPAVTTPPPPQPSAIPPLLPPPRDPSPLAPTSRPPDRPKPVPSGSAQPSASAPSFPAPPAFSVPPFTFPTGFPPIVNPFPSPGGSGVGPVITLPTAFPPFGAPTPLPPASAAPSH